MAVPESEEVGFKRIGLSVSDYDANLPIKKRRFPVVQFSPSPSEDISSFHLDGNLLKIERPSPPKKVSSFNPDENSLEVEQPSLSVTIVSSSSADTCYGLSNRNQDCVSNENKRKSDTHSCYVDMVQNDIGMPGVEFLGPGLGGHEDKSLVTEKHSVHRSLEIYSGLKLSSTGVNSDPLASDKEEEIDVKMPEEKCSSSICQVEGGAEVSVGLKGHMDPKLVSDKQNSLEPVLMDLSLNKQGSSSHCVKGNVGSDCDGSLLQSSREKWDLNTSMDSWALLDCEHKGNSIKAFIPSKELLHLSLNSSSPKPTLEEDPYVSEYESDGNRNIAEVVDDDDKNVEEDYEDGEVRESMRKEVHACEKREIEPSDHADCDDKKINSAGLPDHECFTLGPLEQETKPENLDFTSEDDVHTTTKSTSCEQEHEDLCVKEPHAVENAIGEDVNRPMKAAGRGQLSQYVNKDKLKGHDTADEIVDGIEELIPKFSQGEMEKAIAVDVEQNRDLTLPTIRLDNRSGEWDFGPNFSPETYSDQQIHYHVPDLDHDRYKTIPDGPFGGANRRGRQLLDNEGPFFFHGPSRRRSPGGTHGPSAHGGKMG